MLRMAFDIGGTFTDFVLVAGGVSPRFLKLPTTPEDPAKAVEEGFDMLLQEAGQSGKDLEAVLHATTIATNAIIERKGAPTALVTTEGFKDVLIIGRQKRYETYDLYMEKPPALVARRSIFEVSERIDHRGTVLKALDQTALKELVSSIKNGGYSSIAVALLHAYANTDHEKQVERILKESCQEFQ